MQRLTDAQFLDALQAVSHLRRAAQYKTARSLAVDLLLAERPNEPAVWHALGQIYTELGVFDLAFQAHAEAFRLIQQLPIDIPSIQSMSLGLAQARMRFGHFEEFNTAVGDFGTWDLWESGRLRCSWEPPPGVSYFDRWEHREGVEVPSLLVQSEGGYGDFFMFSRWLPLLKAKFNVQKLGLVIWAPLEKFADYSSWGFDHVYIVGRDQIRYSDWMYATSVMSMPALFDLQEWADIPPPNPSKLYVGPYSAPRDPKAPLRVGFCWRAEENSSPVRTKSLPFEVAEEIVDVIYTKNKNCAVFSLSPEKSDLYNNAVAFKQPHCIPVEGDRMSDWNATAGYLRSMDFILTVDTAVAHLTGMLGVPALVLLPCSSCWRWRTPDILTGPWYGRQLTYYRQREPLEWDAAEIATAALYKIKPLAGSELSPGELLVGRSKVHEIQRERWGPRGEDV